MSKIGRNEPCWCKSGKKYKKCHYLRSDENAHPISRLLADLWGKISHKECLHPEAGKGVCGKKIIDAHSIQKNGPLKHIVDSTNHVYAFGINSHGEEEVSKIGWQKASTFKGFCDVHDKAMFSPIEDHDFIGTNFQCFLVGYRAYALEYFKKVSVLKGMPFMKQNLDRGMLAWEQIELQHTLEAMNQGFLKGMEDFKATLDLYTSSYKNKSYDQFESASIYFSGDLSIVVGGAFTPEFTVDGKRIQFLGSGLRLLESVSVNTMVSSRGYAIVFTWPKQFNKCRRFIQSLLKIEIKNLSSALVEIMFSYIENIYFSKSWLESLSSEKRGAIEKMARKPIQYGESIRFTNQIYTNWVIDRVVIY